MSCSHVCSVRDRRHRFPSLIDAFLSVHDRFHFRFDRFLDRFRFLKHDVSNLSSSSSSSSSP